MSDTAEVTVYIAVSESEAAGHMDSANEAVEALSSPDCVDTYEIKIVVQLAKVKALIAALPEGAGNTLTLTVA